MLISQRATRKHIFTPLIVSYFCFAYMDTCSRALASCFQLSILLISFSEQWQFKNDALVAVNLLMLLTLVHKKDAIIDQY